MILSPAQRARRAILLSLVLLGATGGAILIGLPRLATISAVLCAAVFLIALARFLKDDRS